MNYSGQKAPHLLKPALYLWYTAMYQAAAVALPGAGQVIRLLVFRSSWVGKPGMWHWYNRVIGGTTTSPCTMDTHTHMWCLSSRPILVKLRPGSARHPTQPEKSWGQGRQPMLDHSLTTDPCVWVCVKEGDPQALLETENWTNLRPP